MESSSWSWQPLPTILDSANQASFASIDWLLVVLLLAALFLAASSAAAETALTSVSRIKLRKQAEEGDVRAQRTLLLLEHPQNVLSTILVVSNVSVIVASTVATILAISLFVKFGEIISTIVLSFIVLIFCEITPKTIAVQAPEVWAKRLSAVRSSGSAFVLQSGDRRPHVHHQGYRTALRRWAGPSRAVRDGGGAPSSGRGG